MVLRIFGIFPFSKEDQKLTNAVYSAVVFFAFFKFVKIRESFLSAVLLFVILLCVVLSDAAVTLN